MNLKTYIDTYGREEGQRLAKDVGTVWQYVYQCANGYRRPSVELAQRMVKASGHRLDLVSLLTVEKKQVSPKASA